MKQLVARAYIRGSIPQCSLPARITDNVSLCSPESGPQMFIDKEANTFGENASFVVDIHDLASHLALQWVQAAVQTLQIASPVILDLFAFWSADVGTITLQDDNAILWGHNSDELTAEAIQFAKEHTASVESVLLPETHSRVSNAIRLYFEALRMQNAEFALLGFIGSLESLFSTPQELSFRLSLQLAKFLGKNTDDQRRYFDRARKLYDTRSKIAHGSKLAGTEEATAIQLVESWTPEAEELTRLSIKRLLECNLIGCFNNKEKLNELLKELVFSETVYDAINTVSSKTKA